MCRNPCVKDQGVKDQEREDCGREDVKTRSWLGVGDCIAHGGEEESEPDKTCQQRDHQTDGDLAVSNDEESPREQDAPHQVERLPVEELRGGRGGGW